MVKTEVGYRPRKALLDRVGTGKLIMLKSAYETIQKTGDSDRRITIGWLCMIAGLRESEIKGRLHRFPEIRASVKEVVEEKDEWLVRRFKKIAEKKRKVGESLRLSDIKREMSLKPNTYKGCIFD